MKIGGRGVWRVDRRQLDAYIERVHEETGNGHRIILSGRTREKTNPEVGESVSPLPGADGSPTLSTSQLRIG